MDTHAVIGKLQEEYGMAPRTAEAIVYAVQQGQENIKGLATKEDLAHVKDYLEGKIDRLDERMNHFEERMDRFEERMNRFEEKMEGRIDRLEEKMEGRMDRIEATVSTLSKELADFKVRTAKWIIGLFVGLAGLQIAVAVFIVSVLT